MPLCQVLCNTHEINVHHSRNIYLEKIYPHAILYWILGITEMILTWSQFSKDQWVYTFKWKTIQRGGRSLIRHTLKEGFVC